MFPNITSLTLGYCKALTSGIFLLENSTNSKGLGKDTSPRSAPPTASSEMLNFHVNPGMGTITEAEVNDETLTTTAVSGTTSAAREELVSSSKLKIQPQITQYTTWTAWRNLKFLNLQRCTGIRDDAFLQWHTISPVWRLETLLLGDCSLITDLALESIISCCPRLKILSLAFCCALTESCVQYLVNLSRLSILDLSFCGSLVSTASIKSLTEKCTSLERLGLRGCVRVDDEFLTMLLARAQANPSNPGPQLKLKVINLSQCRSISTEMMKRVKTIWTCLETESVIEFDGAEPSLASAASMSQRFNALGMAKRHSSVNSTNVYTRRATSRPERSP
jgi:hypothetical protein